MGTTTVHETTPDTPRKRSAWRPLALGVALLAVALAGVWWFGIRDTATDPAAELHGVWETPFPYYIVFDEGGKWEGRPYDPQSPATNWGTYTFDDDTLTMFTAAPGRADVCQEGQTGIYDAAVTDTGNLKLTVINDPCGVRAADFRSEMTPHG